MMQAAEVIASDCWFDFDNGILDRSIFDDEQIYRQELKQIFGRAWNFMAHESQLKKPGDYFVNWIGADEVIAVRDKNNQVQVLLNTCPHRGNKLCRAESGSQRSFVCTYHGWTFNLDGTLARVPGFEDFYRSDIDREKWGLAKAAKVESYKGFIFATLDPTAPPLETYLGWVGKLGIDYINARGEVEVVDGIQKNIIECNWKLAVDNLSDWYHPQISHASAISIGAIPREELWPHQQAVMFGDYGHAISGPRLTEQQYADNKKKYAGIDPNQQSYDWVEYFYAWRAQSEAEKLLGPIGVRTMGHPNIFPNFWACALLGTQFCLRIPRGIHKTELWWFTILPKHASPQTRQSIMDLTIHAFGPAGLLEQDDGENWSHSTCGAKGVESKKHALNFQMGAKHDQMINHPSGQNRIDTVINEHGQRWFYKSWQEWMQAKSLEELINQQGKVPAEEV